MILEIILVILGIPIGYLLAFLARDELVAGRKWFIRIIVLGVIAVTGFDLYRIYYAAWTSLFIIIIAAVALKKSYDKKWTKVRK
ncbi:MAG: hypothetical protein Q7S74_01160 [Nanoarchaeota archaeon]|nr:hypothetical protein [Nanoarchaeota archaeon]